MPAVGISRCEQADGAGAARGRHDKLTWVDDTEESLSATRLSFCSPRHVSTAVLSPSFWPPFFSPLGMMYTSAKKSAANSHSSRCVASDSGTSTHVAPHLSAR